MLFPLSNNLLYCSVAQCLMMIENEYKAVNPMAFTWRPVLPEVEIWNTQKEKWNVEVLAKENGNCGALSKLCGINGGQLS